MNSKKIFGWSKRQSGSEPTYYRTGGLLPIDTVQDDTISNGVRTKAAPMARRTRPAPLKIIPPDKKQLLASPLPTPYSTVLTNAAFSLQTAFNDILRSPAPGAMVCTSPATIHKPLPGRPRSISLPPSPKLPVELPGSLLQENQGYPLEVNVPHFAPARPVTQNVRRSTHPPDGYVDGNKKATGIEDLSSRPLNHSTSVPFLDKSLHNMRSVRSGNALNAQPSPHKVQRKKSQNDTSLRKRSRPDLALSPSANDSKVESRAAATIEENVTDSTNPSFGAEKVLQSALLIVEGQGCSNSSLRSVRRRGELETASTPTPTATRTRQIEELKATIAAQDQTISSLQGQFASLRASHEGHVASLSRAHAAEVSSLKNHAQVLEDQLARRPSLHHASSNNLLFYLDTSEPQTPSRSTANPEAVSVNSIRSSSCPSDKQPRSSQRPRNSPEMENLKRKLSTTRRVETTGRNLLPELNQYKQNNVALQKQIESLMAKLNESKKNERALKASLGEAERRSDEWQDKAQAAEQLSTNAQALQNTIDHLENRLEIANTERLDAEEQLCNLQAGKSPFELQLPKLQVVDNIIPKEEQRGRNAHLSMSTIFSSGSPTSPENESQDLSTLAAFIAHIERLQDQARQKDARILELEEERDELRQKYDQLEQEHNANTLQLDIQNELLNKTQETDAHVERLRGAIIDRETVIKDKEKAIAAVERQLSLHKLLLHAEIRRHAALSISASVPSDPLPELNNIATKTDVDKWITKLQERLKNEIKSETAGDSQEAGAEAFRKEIDFYVREIIYYKLDIRGYKSDIKKLKRITAQLSSYGRTSDLDSETSSLRRGVTPNQIRTTTDTPELAALDTSLPTLAKAATSSIASNLPITPPLSGTERHEIAEHSGQHANHSETGTHSNQRQSPGLMTPQTPNWKVGFEPKSNFEDVELATSPRSLTRPPPEWRNSMPPSPTQSRDGQMFGDYSMSTLSAPKSLSRQRSSSESTITLRAAPVAPEIEGIVTTDSTAPEVEGYKRTSGRVRSASLPESNKGRATPERPPRPRYGLFEAVSPGYRTEPEPWRLPQTDVLAASTRYNTNENSGLRGLPISRHGSNASSMRIATPVIGRDIQDSSVSTKNPWQAAAKPRLNTDIPRAGSEDPGAQLTSPPERKLSSASASSVPFVIAMGSPHNPALITPTSSVTPTPCPITRNAPLKLPNTSRVGVGGTMASYTPVTSPTTPVNSLSFQATQEPSRSKQMPEPVVSVPIPIPAPAPAPATKPSRKFSLSRKQEEPLPSLPRTPSHSRNVSGNSIRTAIRLPKGRDGEGQRVRKESISLPRPLGSPFDYERTAGGARRNDTSGGADGFGIGEAF